MVVRSRSRSCGGGDICGTTPAFRSDVNIATDVAILNSKYRKKQRTNAKSERSKCCGLAIYIRRKIDAVIAVHFGSALGDVRPIAKTHLHTK